jgi:nicotinate dehydrogenase subunit A
MPAQSPCSTQALPQPAAIEGKPVAKTFRRGIITRPRQGDFGPISARYRFSSSYGWTIVPAGRVREVIRHVAARFTCCHRTGPYQGNGAIMAQKFTINVNGKDHTVDADPDMPLLYALRNDLGLNNPHFGCGLAQCGACTVHLDGQAIRSCVTPVSAVGNAKVVTLAGLGTPEKPHPLQTAYVEEQVPQCAYCINGWIMTAAAFLKDKKKPTDAEIKTALEGLKCRCGTHMGILRAVKRAAEMMG